LCKFCLWSPDAVRGRHQLFIGIPVAPAFTTPSDRVEPPPSDSDVVQPVPLERPRAANLEQRESA